MRILVTGAAGFIGSHAVERLLARGHEVVGLDSFDDFYDPAVKRRNLSAASGHDAFRLVEADVRDAAAWAALPEADAVVHLAARPGVRASIRDPDLCQEVNVGGTQRMLEHCRERGVDRVIFGSSSSVYGNTDRVPFREDARVDEPISPYAASKAAGELLCHTYHHLFGMRVAALRLFTVYGPRQRPDLAIHKFTRLLLAGEPIPRYGDGSSERDYTYIDDLLDGLEGALAWLDRGEGPRWTVANLGSGRTVRLSDMIEALGEVAGVEPEVEALPEQPGDVERTYADITRARELFGYDPDVPFRQGLERFVAWYRERRDG